MDYNTEREALKLPEYGRNIQNMVNYIISIEDKEERTLAAKSVIDVMSQLNGNGNNKAVEEYRQKLWNHLFIISDFNLEVNTEFEKPTKEILNYKPEKLSYSTNRIAYRYYGKTIENLILKAVDIENKEEKDALILMIANHMKKTYMLWNKGFVNDDIIKQHLEELSNNQLTFPENYQLNSKTEIISKNRKRRRNNNNNNNNNKLNNRKRR